MAAAVNVVVLLLLELELLELALDHADRELAGVDRGTVVQILQQIRQGADVVLMAVRDEDAAQLLLVLENVGVIGQHEVDAGLRVIGEHEAGVDQDHVVAVLEGRHVLADAVEAAERDDLEGRRLLLCVVVFCHVGS